MERRKPLPWEQNVCGKRIVDKETEAETLTLSTMRRKMNTWQDDSSHTIDVSKELHANFNCPKVD